MLNGHRSSESELHAQEKKNVFEYAHTYIRAHLYVKIKEDFTKMASIDQMKYRIGIPTQEHMYTNMKH